MNALAQLYNHQRRYDQAETLCVEALEMRKRLFVSNHPLVVGAILSALAGFYFNQGKYDQAEPLFVEALEMTKRVFVGDHPDVAESLYALAGFYFNQGKYDQAEPLFVEALEMRKRLFVGDHPDVAESLYALARLYCDQGRYDQAEPLFVEALEICQQVLGINYFFTAEVREQLIILQRKRTAFAQIYRNDTPNEIRSSNAEYGDNQPLTPVQNHIFCTTCGQKSPANSNFCFKCGTQLNKW